MNRSKKGLRRFWSLEDGLVTQEWVALTAGMVIAAVAVSFIVMNNTYKEGSKVGGNILNTRCAIFAKNPLLACP